VSLKPEMSLGASFAVMALDYGIYQVGMPKTADIKSSAPHNQAIAGSLRAADWTAIGASAALSLLAKDPNIFIFGAGFAVILHFMYSHANMVSPQSGEVTMPPAGGTVPGGVTAAASS
jgi:hypothetical protein